MPKGRPGEKYERWKAEKIEQQKRQVDQRTRLLPEDLADEILAVCDREREAIKERIAVLDESEARLDEWIEETAAEKWEAMPPVNPEHTEIHENARGELVEVTRGSDTRRVSTEASREISRKLRNLKQRKSNHQAERRHRMRQLAEIRKVRRSAERGVYSAVMAVVSGWRNAVEIGGLADKVKMGASYTDAAGNPLPSEALNEDGTPADLPSAKEAREGK